MTGREEGKGYVMTPERYKACVDAQQKWWDEMKQKNEAALKLLREKRALKKKSPLLYEKVEVPKP